MADRAGKKKKPKKERSAKAQALIWIFVLMIVDEITPGIPLAEALLIALLLFLPRWFLHMVHRVYEYVPHRQAWRSVGDICRRQMVTVLPDTPVIEAARRMRDEHARSLVVVEKRSHTPPEGDGPEKGGGKDRQPSERRGEEAASPPSVPASIFVPVGILTDRDIALRVEAEGLSWEGTTVAEVMTARPEVALASENVHAAMEKMRELGARQLPVVDARGAILGTISLDDSIAMLSDSLDDMVELLRREMQKEARAGG